ncbi:MAG: hypothetical protein DMG07_04335 [Acidobacteria bacterium]|nr:MAG: hypothetical protein DMG07_04335 [Acidobacteriota bacterium]
MQHPARVLLLVTLLAAPPALAAGPEYRATVTPTEARFVFPVGEKETWHWDLTDTSDNQREYAWTVGVETGGESYDVGFTLFKFHGAKPDRGTLSQLLNAGQTNLWVVKDDGGTVVEGRVEAEARDDSVIVVIRDKNVLDRLFSRKPAAVKFEARTPEGGRSTQEVKVAYPEK